MASLQVLFLVCRAIKRTVKGFPRPQLDLSAKSFAKVFNLAFGRVLKPSFDSYANSLNYLLASYLVPYVGLTGYVGANPKLLGAASKRVIYKPNIQPPLKTHSRQTV